MAQNILQPEPNAQGTGTAIGQHRGKKAHGVGALGIAHRLDMCMFVDVDAGADGDALRQILRAVWHTRPNDRFRICAYVLAQPIADTWERAVLLEPEEQFHSTQRRCRKDHRAAGESAGLFVNPRQRVHGANLVSCAAIAGGGQRFDVYHLGLWKNYGPILLRQVEIIEVKRVFRTVAAAHHATAAGGARASRRTFSGEKWIGKSLVGRFPFGRLQDSDSGAIESVARARDFAGSLQEVIGGSEDLILSYSQHARCSLKVPMHLRLPVSQPGPRSALPDFIRRKIGRASCRER